jgi:hypothetical protein
LEIGGQKFRDEAGKLNDEGLELEIEGLSFLLESPKRRHRKSLPTKNGLKVLKPYFLKKMKVWERRNDLPLKK